MEPLERPARHLALAAAGACAAAVFILAAKVHRSGTGLLWIDVQGQRVAYGHVLGTAVLPLPAAEAVVRLGDTPAFIGLVALFVVAALTLRDRLSATVAVLAVPLALLATEIIGKPLVARREGFSYGFPSGHATVTATLLTLVALFAYRRWGGRGVATVAPAAVLAPLMGLSLVRLNYHRFSDTVAGALVGCGMVLALAGLLSVASSMRAPAQAVSQDR